MVSPQHPFFLYVYYIDGDSVVFWNRGRSDVATAIEKGVPIPLASSKLETRIHSLEEISLEMVQSLSLSLNHGEHPNPDRLGFFLEFSQTDENVRRR